MGGLRLCVLIELAGTQAFTEGIVTALVDTSELTGGLAQGAGLMINFVFAEWVVRRPKRGRTLST